MAESTLASAMLRLRGLASRDWGETPDAYELRPNTRLAKAVEGLGGAAGGGVRVSRLERAREAWLRRHSIGGQLSRMELTALCWDPKIAVQAEFARALAGQASLGGRAIRGLMTSHHEDWPPPSADLEGVLGAGLTSLERCRGPVMKWQPLSSQLVGLDAPTKFAQGCVNEKLTVTERLTALGLSATSGFARGCASAVADIVTSPAYAPVQVEFALTRFFIEDDALLNPIGWGRAFGQLVTNDHLLAEGLDRQRLVELALQDRKLPDPRIRSAGWQNVPEAARDRVVNWLSEEDLRFFFDLIMEGQADPHGRYPFWYHYIGRAVRARVVVGPADHARLSTQLEAIRDRGRSYARLRQGYGTVAKISAFIMDFGEVTVVEFSQVGSACYFYENHAAPHLDFSSQGYDLSQLKNKGYGTAYSHTRGHVVADGIVRGGWQAKFRQLLSAYGVRPE